MSLSDPTSPFSPQALLGTFLCGLPAATLTTLWPGGQSHICRSGQLWPKGWGYTQAHILTHSPTFPPNPRPVPTPGGWTFENCKGPFWRWLTLPGEQSRMAARSQQPALSLPSPGNAQQGLKLAGELSVSRQGWFGPGHSDHRAKRWTGHNLLLLTVLGLQAGCQAARPRKGRGPSTPGSQHIILLKMELPLAVLASLIGALQRGHGLRREGSSTAAPEMIGPVLQ